MTMYVVLMEADEDFPTICTGYNGHTETNLFHSFEEADKVRTELEGMYKSQGVDYSVHALEGT